MGYTRVVNIIVYSLLLSVITAQHENDSTARSLYIPNIHAKGGWRPILSSSGISSYNLASVLGTSTSIGQKILTGPALIETKVISPHIVSVSPVSSQDIFGNGILSTSTRPIVTREVKNIAQAYKPTMYQAQSSLNFNAPVSSYMNPFALPSNMAINHYKTPSSYQYDSNIFIRHPQTIVSHRPPYNKIQGQMVVGKRYKPNQHQSQMIHQYANSQYHPTYTNSAKKPLLDTFPPGYAKPLDNLSNQGSNHHTYVNAQDSLDAQTKNKQTASPTPASVSTYKPPLGSHFQQFGFKEELFGPIPSSILGSFSSFGHATVKARDPNENKVTYAPVSSTKSPYSTIEPYTAHSTVSVNTKTYPKDAKPTSTINFHHKIKDDFSVNLVPPSQAPFKYLHNYTSTDKKKQYASSNDFIPSPVDPLSKLQNNGDIIKIQPEKTNAYSTYNINIGGSRKPEISSFFDTTPPPVSTVDPFEPQSTNAVPNNLLVQVPPPYTNINTFNKDHVVKNQNAPNKEVKFHQSFTSVTHGKYGSFDEVKYYPPRGHEYFEKVPKNPQNQKTKEKIPHKTTYEVTEHWGSSGEANTQPPLNSWNAPSQSYKNFNSYVPKPQYNTIAENGKRVIPPPFYPTPMSSSAPEITSPGDISTIYPSAADNSANSFFSQLENSLSTLAQIDGEIGDEVHDLATPTSNTVNVSSANEYKYPSTEFYEDIPITTTNPPPNTRRKPSKYRNPTETTTESATESDLKDFTTRFETYKEQVSAADQDVDLATIPPSKHFKRPSTTLTTTTSSIHWDEESRKRIKNRRRKPTKHLPTDFNTADSITTTEATRVNRFKTTSGSDQDNSYRSRNKFRYNKNRYNKPESDNNGQSVITTTPRQKWNTRTKATTPLSLDLDDFGDTTTHQIEKLPDLNNKQSSIMKIAKDSHKPASINANPTYDNLNEFPDYSHKQDEKDTPTSDIAISSIEYNYEQQPSHTDTVEYKPDDTKSSLSSVADVISSPTSPGLSEENIAANSISQTTRSEQLFTNLKSGSRGSTKADGAKSDSEISATANLDVSSTTPTPVGAKLNKIKSKPNKYDSNRPRFSVKDYRNRLNQMTTSTSTEKPNQSSEPGPKLKFPSRSRFPILKDHLDVKASAPDTNSTTESPRKKFAPKDPRHRDDVEEKVEEKVKIQTKSKAENTPIIKPINSLRGGLRRDPNRNKVAVVNETTVEPLPQEEKPIEVSSKRPILSGLRKRISQKNHTSEVVPAETKISEVSDIISEASVNNITVEVKPEVAEEKQSSETAIMKIAKDDKRRQDDNVEDFLDPSQRVSDLTLASSKEYNTPGLFKSVSPNSRRVPSYFTIATDDPILPIEAFFPQLNQKKEA